MLCAESLRLLEAATPVAKRSLPSEEDALSSAPSDDSSRSGHGGDATTSGSTTTGSTCSPRAVGLPRGAHSAGHTAALDSVEKWVHAALRRLGKTADDLVLQPSLEPNDPLASEVHELLADWHATSTCARDAGVVADVPALLARRPPDGVVVKGRNWMQRHINERRCQRRLPELPDDWGRRLAGRRADVRRVNEQARARKAADGTLFHDKHDLAPTREQLMAMTYAGLAANAAVDPDVLNALEASMAVALYLATGARGSELKGMPLQSLRIERLPHERTGQLFPCLKLTAFGCKTKARHLNQFLAHSNPWRCAVGLLGLSILARARLHGPPPVSLRADARSWNLLGTKVTTLDRRLKDLFRVAGVRRQHGDPLTYLGRHFGSRLLQHAGGSAEGGAAWRGHGNGTASYAYTECPLPDLLRLVGNDPDAPFVPAHLVDELLPLAYEVVRALVPELDERASALDARHAAVDAMGRRDERVRTDEQLNGQSALLDALRYACAVGVLCLCARPRTWRRWAILETEATLWQRATSAGGQRLVYHVFGGVPAAVAPMARLAAAVRRSEEAELTARRVGGAPGGESAAAVADAVRAPSAARSGWSSASSPPSGTDSTRPTRPEGASAGPSAATTPPPAPPPARRRPPRCRRRSPARAPARRARRSRTSPTSRRGRALTRRSTTRATSWRRASAPREPPGACSYAPTAARTRGAPSNFFATARSPPPSERAWRRASRAPTRRGRSRSDSTRSEGSRRCCASCRPSSARGRRASSSPGTSARSRRERAC